MVGSRLKTHSLSPHSLSHRGEWGFHSGPEGNHRAQASGQRTKRASIHFAPRNRVKSRQSRAHKSLSRPRFPWNRAPPVCVPSDAVLRTQIVWISRRITNDSFLRRRISQGFIPGNFHTYVVLPHAPESHPSEHHLAFHAVAPHSLGVGKMQRSVTKGVFLLHNQPNTTVHNHICETK